MKILLVCPFFPPENTIAAVRIGKFAANWAGLGHEVTVLCRTPVSAGLGTVTHPNLRLIPVKDPFGSISGSVSRVTGASKRSLFSQFVGAGKALAKRLAWPDLYAPWAVRSWFKLSKLGVSADVVVASGGPFSSMLLGKRVARRYGLPLVLDYRDFLAFGAYYDQGRLRTAVDQRVEAKLVRSAALVATVSEPMRAEIAELFAVPAVTVTNGFDPVDFDELRYEPSGTALNLIYCGQIYPGRRDPSALFEAIAVARANEPAFEVTFNFYGRGLAATVDLARQYGVSDLVYDRGPVSHSESLRLQAGADWLVLLLWNDPRERGVLSGKLFEYIGAARPIIMLGFEHGAAASLIRDNSLGVVSNDPEALAKALIDAWRTKRRIGQVPRPSELDQTRFTRSHQSALFMREIQNVLSDERA